MVSFQAALPIRRLHTVWEQLVFGGNIRTLSKSDFVDMSTRDYIADPRAYRRKFKAGYKDLMSLSDVNKDNRIDVDEHARFLKVLDHKNNANDMASFWMAYKTSGGVPLDTVVDAWLQFLSSNTTTTKNDTIDSAIKIALKSETDTAWKYLAATVQEFSSTKMK